VAGRQERSAKTGRYVGTGTEKKHPNVTVTERGGRRSESRRDTKPEQKDLGRLQPLVKQTG